MGRLINGKLVFTRAECNNPELSKVMQIAVETAFGCEGEVLCGGGDTPHMHLRITGLEPEAGPRWEWIPLDCGEA